MKRLCKGLLAILLVVGALGACGGGSKKDPKEIIDKAVKKSKEVESMEVGVDLLMEVSIKSGKNTVGFNVDMNMSLDYLVDEMIAHGTTEMDMEVMGMKESTKTEMYILEEDGEMVSYTSEDGEYWTSGDAETMMPFLGTSSFVSGFKQVGDLNYKGEDKVDGKKTDVVECDIKGKDIQSAMEMFGETEVPGLGTFDGVDLSKSDMTIEMQFYQESGLLASINMDMTEMFDSVMSGMSKEDVSLVFGEDSEIEVSAFEMKFTYTDYDKVKEFEVPDDLEINEFDYDDYDDEDTSEVIKGVEEPKGPWDTFQFNLSDKTLQLPVQYSDLVAAGFEIDSSSDKKIKVDGKSSEVYIILSNEAGEILTVDFYNDSDTEKPITECLVSSISLMDFDAENVKFELPGGIKLGSTEEELNKAYPEFYSKTVDYGTTYSYGYKDLEKLDIYVDSEGIVYMITIEKQK